MITHTRIVIPAYSGYYNPLDDQSKVIYGQGCATCLRDEVQRIGNRALLITSKTLMNQTDLVEQVSALLGSNLAGVYASSAPHTPRSAVLKAAEMARSLNPDVIISFGGGSHSDVAKAVRMAIWQGITDEAGFDRAFQLYKNNWRMDGQGHPNGHLLPQIGIPTTLISAEHTQGVGITNEKTHGKQVFSHPDLRSQVILLDPELSVATPQTLWLSTGIKALEHAIAKLSALERDPVIDAIAAQAVSILSHELVHSWQDPADLSARGNLLVGSWLCMFGSWESLAKRMGLSHALGRQIGGVSGAPHGMISAVMLPLCMNFNASVSAVGLEMTAKALGVDTASMRREEAALAAAEAARSLVAELELPTRLREIGVAEADLPLIARQTMSDMSCATNPRPVKDSGEVLELLTQAW